ncbi:hypothetical protein [Stenotrophomonas sepilia]|uniref:hypothetical protein n=1 Tax=Stenotrophomonas sepilia TaxID=2860290 RepID=UPI003EE6E0ED
MSKESSTSTNLNKAIKHALKIGLIISGCFFAVQPGLADTTDLGTVDAQPPIDYDPPPVDIPGLGDNDNGGGGGSGGGGGEGSPSVPCATLILQKPAECPNPIPMPGGIDYGREQFAAGSGLAKTLYYHQQDSTAPKARGQIAVALNTQTNLMAEGTYTMNEINEMVFTYFSLACKYQTEASNAYRIGLGLTVPEKNCLDAMGKLQAEAAQTMSFTGFFLNWLNKEGISISDFFPQTIVNLLSPANSTTVKYNLITKDATCSRWWQQIEQNQCKAP